MTVPVLKDWKNYLKADLEKLGNKKEDLIQVISICDGYSKEIQSGMGWLVDTQSFIELIRRQYRELYRIRFGKSLPEQIEQVTIKQLKELSQEEKRKEILQLVQAKAPGSKISASEIQGALEQKGFTIKASNPRAVISTIVYSFKKEVEKSPGEGGVFIRKKPAEGMLPT